jgi:hypothetical protein
MDLVYLRARQAADERRIALSGFEAAACGNNPASAAEAAKTVLARFQGREYDLDLFCKVPSHRHGNQLRDLLHSLVTGGVTPAWWEAQRSQVLDLLAGNRLLPVVEKRGRPPNS